MRHVIAKFGLAAAAAVSVSLAAAQLGTARAKASSARVYIAANACAGHAFKPPKVTFACADGNAYATNLRYSSYGSRQAQASGTMHVNSCTPNCAAGRFQRRAGKVRFFNVVTCADGRRYFARARYRYGGHAASADIQPFNCKK